LLASEEGFFSIELARLSYFIRKCDLMAVTLVVLFTPLMYEPAVGSSLNLVWAAGL
jgi:hypothetical protein